ncbi:hypothetical protein DL96DRAFT_1722000 [Flagelloscypha sp. PMI_526]|nr:hypothetical protein DL96DRAFT_1722000 [Flagelloscypha sp. PMI_526]
MTKHWDTFLSHCSSIRSLHLCGCKLIERDGSSSSLELAAYKAKVENLRLYCAGQDPDDGLAWILSLTSPISSFNLTNLSSLELWAICVHDESWIATILDAQKSDFILQHLGLFGVEGYPTKGLLKQSLSRFTSVCKLSISEATMPIFRRNFMEVEGITFGYAAAWISILPANITSTVEELDIHIEASCWLHGPLGVDEILSYNSLNAMSKVKQVKLHLEETSEEFDADVFLREEWYNNCEDTELYHEPDQVKLREWVASVVLPKTYLEGKVSIEG